MNASGQQFRPFAAVTAVGLLLLVGTGSAAANENWTAAKLLDPEQSVLAPRTLAPFPLSRLSPNAGLSFDLGGSEEQKLELQLAQPLMFGTALTQRDNLFGDTETIVGGALGWMANDNIGVSIASSQSTMDNSFQALGSIHCQDGVLARDSFTASNCYFIDQPEKPSLETLSIGLDYSPTEFSRTGISLFRQQLSTGSDARTGFDLSPAAQAGFPGAIANPFMQPIPGQNFSDAESEITGIDLEFQLGIATDRAGDIRLGLQLTRILDANISGQNSTGTHFQNWDLSSPADSARVSLDWQKGAFSGGVESYYRAPIEFMNRSSIESAATFDVHFTWRTPWNANLSVGASNLLNSGPHDNASKDTNLVVDPFESVYGRIPYVRYEQDL